MEFVSTSAHSAAPSIPSPAPASTAATLPTTTSTTAAASAKQSPAQPTSGRPTTLATMLQSLALLSTPTLESVSPASAIFTS